MNYRNSLIYILITILLFSHSLSGQSYSKGEIKAAYINKILPFVNWPKNSPDTLKYKITIFGQSDDNESLLRFFHNAIKTEKYAKISVVNQVENISDCNILFINKTTDTELNHLLSTIEDRDILIFSDTKNYAKKGTHINFYQQDYKIKFEINLNKIEADGFYINSLLLDYAKIIEG